MEVSTLSPILAAFVLVDDKASETNVVIPILPQHKEVVRAMTHLAQLRTWMKAHIDDGLPYQEILENLEAVQNPQARLTIRIERAV